MRAIFFGTPALAVPALAALTSVAEVVLVTTNPDRPRGRSGRPQPSPVKEAASSWGLPLAQPDQPGEDLQRLRALAPDVAVVVAYGQKISSDLLGVPDAGFVNIHFSLLPRWRGASPVVRAILAGDAETGVTLMKMDEGWDTGAIIGRESVPVGETETAGVLTARLSAQGARLLAASLPGYLAGEIEPIPQPEEGVTAAARVRVEEAFVDPSRHTREAVLRAIRAFAPAPGAWTTLGEDRLKLWRAAPWPGTGPEPGMVTLEGDHVLLGATDGVAELLEVQPAGRSRQPAVDWMRGRRGERVFLAR